MGEVREEWAVVGLRAGWVVGLGIDGCCGWVVGLGSGWFGDGFSSSRLEGGEVKAELSKVACRGEVAFLPRQEGRNEEMVELGIERLPDEGVLRG